MDYKHTEESLEKIINFVLSVEAKDRKALSTIKAANIISIVVENITKIKQEYISLAEAGYALGVSKASVSQALLNNRLIKKKIPCNQN